MTTEGLTSWNKMQYGFLFAVALNNKYLVFLVSDQIPIDIFIHFLTQRMQNVSPHNPLCVSFGSIDVNKLILQRYVSILEIPCNWYKKPGASSCWYDSSASVLFFPNHFRKWSINPFRNSMDVQRKCNSTCKVSNKQSPDVN